jgi:hypothetical protein
MVAEWVGVRGEEEVQVQSVVSLRAQTAVGLRRRFRHYTTSRRLAEYAVTWILLLLG